MLEATIEVRADMVASVLEVRAGVGRAVGDGEVLLVVESMKMEIPVTAPQAGVVTAVHVEAGDIVAEGDLLVALNGRAPDGG